MLAGGLTPVGFDVSETEKLQHGEIHEAMIEVEIRRTVGGCMGMLSDYKWHGVLCEKCLGELVKNKSILKEREFLTKIGQVGR